MKCGMIFECGLQGADVQVCSHLAKLIRQDIEIISITLDNKPKLIARCGEVAASLLTSGCDRVIIVWDLYPPWRDQRPSRDEDRNRILQAIDDAGVDRRRIHLICITEELEAWLLADGRALSAVLSRPTRPVQIPHNKRTDRVSNPKKALGRLFKENLGVKYVDMKHAIWIAKSLPDLGRIEYICSFKRFSQRILM